VPHAPLLPLAARHPGRARRITPRGAHRVCVPHVCA
jgi:hypothetical protein